ncbi:VTT domain-containing protein [Pelagicoccus sp. SDUM812003]|uniref:DedA family protein n=1 Tax=Pelagicoccus sp. SDUM812003 TaxID=3041267 RepID=UPI00280DBE88|nr:VTT domain-containing protein [Pelagicoccus sp. SDUM812003]MDQ8203270.1 VTT domain-containing protein [Pelagicoccus sp. SDUM812003]
MKSKLLLIYLSVLLLSHLVEWSGIWDEANSFAMDSMSVSPARHLIIVFSPDEARASRLVSRGNGSGGGPTDWISASSFLGEQWSPSELSDAEVPGAGQWASVSVVGIGYGAAEATAFAETSSEELRSIVLVDAPLPPQAELLGDRALNAALKTFARAATWLAEWVAPDFGFLDRSGWGDDRWRRIHDADLFASSRFLERSDLPLLAIRARPPQLGRASFLRAVEAVRPDAATLKVTRGNRLEQTVAGVEAFVSGFQDRSGEGGDEDRVSFSAVEVQPIAHWMGGLLLGIATFASEDLACIGGGLLASAGTVSLWVAIAGCLLGIFVGDLGIYLIGRFLGARALELPGLRRLASPTKLRSGMRWFEKKGIMLVVLTRFFPGSRVPTYFAAGVLRIGFWRFAFALLVAASIWTPILVGLSFVFGQPVLALVEGMGAWAWLGVVLFLLLFVFGSRLLVASITWKGRRLLVCKFQRLIRWEYWPVWAVYGPILPYIAWRMVRHRSLTLPSIVNPCMPASGLVYESKGQILTHLQRFGVPVARFSILSLAEPIQARLKALDDFMEAESLGFPVVLKPDVGQRGQGVTIVKDRIEAEAFLRNQKEDTIAQEYVSGSEYGVFYFRFPDRKKGEIFSITDKRMTYVTGDGESTLETLILKDPRAVRMAPFFLSEYEARLAEIVAAGERFWLASVGTHCRGALFLDGAHLLTERLRDEVDRFTAPVEGFHFGRYDLRVPSAEALRLGEGIRVIELNGLTSEPTHMYDPKHSAWHGWRCLIRTWRLIFEIAERNRKLGYKPDSVSSIVKLAAGYFRGVPSRDLS